MDCGNCPHYVTTSYVEYVGCRCWESGECELDVCVEEVA